MLIIPKYINNAGLPEVIEIISETADKFTNTAQICAMCSGLKVIEDQLTPERLTQFRSISRSIRYPLDCINLDLGNATKKGMPLSVCEEQARITQSWITLGAIVETAMKIWLSIYYDEYLDSSWRVWKVNETNIISAIHGTIDGLVTHGEIDVTQAQSLKSIVITHLQARKSVPSLDRIDFIELLRFFKKEVQWGQDTIDYINSIREYRNSIHAYTPRTIGSWNELLQAMRFTCTLLLELTSCTPDCSSQLSAMQDYSD